MFINLSNQIKPKETFGNYLKGKCLEYYIYTYEKNFEEKETKVIKFMHRINENHEESI